MCWSVLPGVRTALGFRKENVYIVCPKIMENGVPPPPARTAKPLKMVENNTSRWSDKGVVCARPEKTEVVTQCITEAQTAMATEVPQSDALEGGGGGQNVAGQYSASLKHHPPAPNHRT